MEVQLSNRIIKRKQQLSIQIKQELSHIASTCSHFWEQGDKIDSVLFINRKMIPKAKLILLLREPVSRAYSQWNHYNQIIERSQTWGWREINFEEAVSLAMDDQAPFNELLDNGKYIDHLQDLLTLYPMEKIFIGTMEKMKDDPNGELAKVIEFLEAAPLELGTETIHQRQYDAPISGPTKTYLQKYFEPYNTRLFELLGREFNEWF